MCIVFLLRIYEWVLGRGEGFQPVPQFTECDHILPRLIITITYHIVVWAMIINVHSFYLIFIQVLYGFFSRTSFLYFATKAKGNTSTIIKATSHKTKEYFSGHLFCAFVILRQKYCNLS